MSDRTTPSPVPQAEVTPPIPDATAAPEPAPEPPAPSPEAIVQQQAAQAAAQAGRDEEAAREEAQATLKATVTAYRKGEREYRAGLLEAGRLGDVYLHQRMALGDKRAAAVQVLEGQLAIYASTAVDANALIACYHAYRLLAEEPGLATGRKAAADGVPYGHYRDGWRQLVQRIDRDTPREAWVLLPGLEAECRELFARAVKDGLSREAVQGHVKALLRAAVDRDAARAKAEAEAAQAEAQRQAEVMRAAQADAEQAAAEARARQEAAERAKAEEKARLTAAAEAAKAELLAKQQQLAAAHAARAQAEAAKARAEGEAQAAAEAQRKAAEKAAKAAERMAAKNAPKVPAAPAGATPQLPTTEARPEPRIASPRAMARAGTAKDVAAMAAELVTGSDTPDDVLAELLARLRTSGQLSAKGKRACSAALGILTGKLGQEPAVGPSPVEVAASLTPAANGQAAVAPAA
jgi:hypothetical protein